MNSIILQIILLSSVHILYCHGQVNGYIAYGFLTPKELDNSIDNSVNSDLFSTLSYKNEFSNEIANKPIQSIHIWNTIFNFINNRRKMFSLIKTDTQPDIYSNELDDNSLKRIPRNTNENNNIDQETKTMSITSNQTLHAMVTSKKNESSSTDKIQETTDKFTTELNEISPTDVIKKTIDKFTTELNETSSTDKIKKTTDQITTSNNSVFSVLNITKILSSTSTLTPPLVTNHTEHDKSSSVTSVTQTTCKALKYFLVFILIVLMLGVIYNAYKKRQQGRRAVYQMGNICRGKGDTPV